MADQLSPMDRAKFAAARRSVDFVQDGMRLGLGTGSTAAWMVGCLAERVRDEGLRLSCVATSARTAELAQRLGLTVVALETVAALDLTIDGADEIDPELALIKGGGAALLREKIVAAASDRMIVIADPGKEVARLGAFPLPVEVIPFGWQTTQALVEKLLASQDVQSREAKLRLDQGQPLRTDEGNFILDLHLKRIGNPQALALQLNQIPGVVENGLFVGICDLVIVGHADGHVALRDRAGGLSQEGAVDMGQAQRIRALLA